MSNYPLIYRIIRDLEYTEKEWLLKRINLLNRNLRAYFKCLLLTGDIQKMSKCKKKLGVSSVQRIHRELLSFIKQELINFYYSSNEAYASLNTQRINYMLSPRLYNPFGNGNDYRDFKLWASVPVGWHVEFTSLQLRRNRFSKDDEDIINQILNNVYIELNASRSLNIYRSILREIPMSISKSEVISANEAFSFFFNVLERIKDHVPTTHSILILYSQLERVLAFFHFDYSLQKLFNLFVKLIPTIIKAQKEHITYNQAFIHLSTALYDTAYVFPSNTSKNLYNELYNLIETIDFVEPSKNSFDFYLVGLIIEWLIAHGELKKANDLYHRLNKKVNGIMHDYLSDIEYSIKFWNHVDNGDVGEARRLKDGWIKVFPNFEENKYIYVCNSVWDFILLFEEEKLIEAERVAQALYRWTLRNDTATEIARILRFISNRGYTMSRIYWKEAIKRLNQAYKREPMLFNIEGTVPLYRWLVARANGTSLLESIRNQTALFNNLQELEEQMSQALGIKLPDYWLTPLENFVGFMRDLWK